MPEGIGEITDFLNRAELGSQAMPDQEVAHVTFRAYEVFIRKNIGRTDDEPALFNEAFDFLFFFRSYLKIILEGDHLPIKDEVFERGFFHGFEEMIDHFNEPEAEAFEGVIPGPIPVSVRDYVTGNSMRGHKYTPFRGK